MKSINKQDTMSALVPTQITTGNLNKLLTKNHHANQIGILILI